jgi:phage replication-related protein YjqB (UPF0714/DUF867 family)
MATFQGLVRRAFNSQKTLENRADHCSLDPERLESIGVVPRSQIRVRRSATLVALYTVSETRSEPNDATVRMVRLGRERLGTDGDFEATIDSQVPNPTLSDEQARDLGEFVERLDDDGCQRGLVALAPHGGMIEQFTDNQAECVAAILGCKLASAWRCKGFSEEHGASRLWHITSSELRDESFPLLNQISHRGFAHAVAFHGFKDDGVLVGGAASPSFRQEIAEALQSVLRGSGIEARLPGPGDDLDGNNPCNVVNRLTASGETGVQIEQSFEARRRFWEEIAHTVASVYARHLPRAEGLHQEPISITERQVPASAEAR